MAIINTYPKATPKGADLLIGTQVKDDNITENSTKSFSVSSIGSLLITSNDITTGSGTTNTIPVWTDGPNGVLGDSIITQDSLGANAVTVAGRLIVDEDLIADGRALFNGEYARFNGEVRDSSNSPGTSGQLLASTASGVEWTSDIDIDGSAEFNYQLATASSAGGAARAFIEIYSIGPSKFRIYRNGPPNPTGDGYARFKIDRTYDYGNEDQMIQEVIYQKRDTTTNVKFKYDGGVDTTDDVYLEFYELPDGSTEAWVCCDDFAYSMVTIFYFESLDTIYPEPVAGTPTGTLIHSTNPDTETPNWDTHKGTGYFSSGVVLESPNGTKYKITVDNSGILSTTAV